MYLFLDQYQREKHTYDIQHCVEHFGEEDRSDRPSVEDLCTVSRRVLIPSLPIYRIPKTREVSPDASKANHPTTTVSLDPP